MKMLRSENMVADLPGTAKKKPTLKSRRSVMDRSLTQRSSGTARLSARSGLITGFRSGEADGLSSGWRVAAHWSSFRRWIRNLPDAALNLLQILDNVLLASVALRV